MIMSNTPFFPPVQLPRGPIGTGLDNPLVTAFVPPVEVQRVLERSEELCRSERNRTSTAERITHAGLVLDKSWSMRQHRNTVLAGFNAQVDVVQEGARAAGRTHVSLNVFADTSEQLMSAVPVSMLKKMGEGDYNPDGNTALYDAIGDTIALLLRQPGADDPNTAFLVAAFTDGDENASRRYTGQLLRDLIVRLEATGRWTFTLMGPRGGAEKMAGSLNIARGNVASFDPQRAESVVGAFSAMASASESYMSMRSMGLTASNALYAHAADSQA